LLRYKSEPLKQSEIAAIKKKLLKVMSESKHSLKESAVIVEQ